MASPNISFDAIPTSLRKPGQYIEFNTRLAINSLPANVQKVLLIGQKLTDAATWITLTEYTAGKIVKPPTLNGHIYICITAGTTSTEPTWPTTQGGEVTDGTVVWKEFHSDVSLQTALTVKQLFSSDDAKVYFGDGSMLHLMAKAALRANPYLNLFAIAAADGAGVFATGTITIAGAPSSTGSGTVRVYIGDDYVDYSFTSSDTATTIATGLKAAIAANTDLPVVAKSAAGVVTVMAKHAGTVANQIKMETEFTASGNLSVTLAQIANGTVDPDIHATSGVIDKIAPEKYDVIALPYNDATSLGYIKTHIDSVSGPIEQRPGIVIAAYVGAIATAQTLADGINSGRIVLALLKAGKTPAFNIAAALAAVVASEEDPARPLNGKQLIGVVAPAVTDRSTRTEQETMLLHGLTPLEVNSEVVEIVRCVSTYQTDVTWLDITTVRTLDYFREACRVRIRVRFARSKLNKRVRSDVRSELIVVAKQLEALQILENVDDNIDEFIVERDSVDVNRLDAKIPADVVNGLHIFAARIDLIL